MATVRRKATLTMGGAALTTGRAARLLGVTTVTVRRWIEMGRLPGSYRTPGGHWRVPRRAVERSRTRQDDGAPPGARRALLFVRVRREQDGPLADRALVHLTQWSLAQGYAVTEIVREIGSGVCEDGAGMSGRREKLEQVRQAVRSGSVDVVVVERPDRLLLLGVDEFIRWAGENGVAVEHAGLSGEAARRAYAGEILADVFYPLADTLALAVGDRQRAEQAAARALGEIADFLLPQEETTCTPDGLTVS